MWLYNHIPGFFFADMIFVQLLGLAQYIFSNIIINSTSYTFTSKIDSFYCCFFFIQIKKISFPDFKITGDLVPDMFGRFTPV